MEQSTGIHLPDTLTNAHTVAHSLLALQVHHAVDDVESAGSHLMETPQGLDATPFWDALRTLALERT